MRKIAGGKYHFAAMLLIAVWVSAATAFALYVGPPWQAAGAAAAAAPLVPWALMAMKRQQVRESLRISGREVSGDSGGDSSAGLGCWGVAALLLACGFGLILTGVARDDSYLERLSEVFVAFGVLMTFLALVRLVARVGRLRSLRR